MTTISKSLALLIAIALSSCATFTEGWVYDKKASKFLSGEEIKVLIQGNTLSYSDQYKTKEYYHENGIAYLYFEESEDFHNQRWCVIDNKLCLDSSGIKLICPKININEDGSIEYNDGKDGKDLDTADSSFVTITKGDTYNIKQDFEDNDWEIHKKRDCP